jgi:predicted nicotinamide N-methyase
MSHAELGPLATVNVRLPGHDTRYQITRPIDIDRLIDAMEHDPEEVLPHWAEIWPSGVALAGEILADPALVRGQRVIELGCGLGVTASAALQAGADLFVTDYATGALDLCRVNTLANAGRTPSMLQLNWRKPGDGILRLAGDGFPVVLAADVLYEARDIEPLLALTERFVAPGGLLWLAEPGRPIAREFVSRIEALGWQSDRRIIDGPWPDERDGAIRVTVYQLRRPGIAERR